MHYTFVTETYPPEINGVALTVQGLEQGLRRHGHWVEVIRPRQGADDVAQGHETLLRGAGIPKYPGMRFGLPAARKLRALWQRHRPDAVYIATEGPLGYSALRVAHALGIPFATGLHTRFDRYMRDYGMPLLEPVALGWMRRFHNRSAATIVPTCELADFLRHNRFEDVVHLPRAVDTARFHPQHRDPALRRQWGVDHDGIAVIYVGRIAAEKNLGLAVRAFRALQQQRPDARYIWVGDGPERAALERANPDFVFTGSLRDHELARHFASADLFPFASRSETFCNVTIEAMASGVPTVAFRYGAAREHLREAHGASIEGADDAAFVDAVLKIGNAGLAERRAMGDAAREAVRKLQPAQVAADLDELFHRIARREEPFDARLVAA